MVMFVREKFRYWDFVWIGILEVEILRRENRYDIWREQSKRQGKESEFLEGEE